MSNPESNPYVVATVTDCADVREGLVSLPQLGLDVNTVPDNIHAAIAATEVNRNLTMINKRRHIAERVVEELMSKGQFYAHAEQAEFATAMYFDNETKCLERIQSDQFQSRLATWLQINRAEGLFDSIISAIEDAAIGGATSKSIIPERFWAARGDAIYISNGIGRITKVTPSKVEIVDNGTDGVLFDCGKTLSPWRLVEPADPFETCALFREVSVLDSLDRLALMLWVTSIPTQRGSKPPLALIGTIRSGKTKFANGLALLLGIPPRESKADERKEDDFWAAVDQGGLFTLDNVDSRITWLPDAVACASTGGTSERRKLYTNGDTVTLRAHAHIILTCANPAFAEDPGLADRLIVVRLNRRTGETSDKALSDEIARNRDGGLSYIAHILSKSLADTQPAGRGLNLRHPDYAEWAVRIGRAMGRESEAVASLRRSENQKALFCLENDAIGSAVRSFINQEKTFEGTAAELLGRLVNVDPEFSKTPLSTKSLSKRLGQLWPHLETVLKVSKTTAHGGSLNYRMEAKE